MFLKASLHGSKRQRGGWGGRTICKHNVVMTGSERVHSGTRGPETTGPRDHGPRDQGPGDRRATGLAKPSKNPALAKPFKKKPGPPEFLCHKQQTKGFSRKFPPNFRGKKITGNSFEGHMPPLPKPDSAICGIPITKHIRRLKQPPPFLNSACTLALPHGQLSVNKARKPSRGLATLLSTFGAIGLRPCQSAVNVL